MKSHRFKYIIKLSFITFLLFSISIILFNSLTDLYLKRNAILRNLGITIGQHHDENRFLVNPLKKSSRQIPPDNINELKINDEANLKGQWSAPIDWNVIAIHAILLPDYSVMTFGTFAITEKENKDLRENKKITISHEVLDAKLEKRNDGKLERDGGTHQWSGHDINAGIDFDIWNINQGHSDDAHQLFIKPLLMDAFCSVVRVIDLDRVFILGGNKNLHSPAEDLPDSQNATMIYNVKKKTFEMSKKLNFQRYYGSVVRTGDNKLLIMGGEDIVTSKKSTAPEIIDLNKMDDGWKILNKANSNDLFGDGDKDPLTPIFNEEWNYPRAFLTSDGNIVGISYNKIWVMNKSDGYAVKKTGEIPLVKGGISKIMEHKNSNTNQESDKKLKLLTIGSAVGSTNSAVMIEKDKVFVFGGKQTGVEYAPSNKVFSIDFSDSNYPKIEELESMPYARSNADATILPTGQVFLNGGHAFSDLEFSNFTPEIYDTKNQTSVELSNSYFRRNYHSTSLLLPDGTILVAGGDAWNAEIFYPPYLFTKDWNNKTTLAQRPEILNLDQNINRGKLIIKTSSSENINKVTLISTGNTTHAQGTESKFRTLQFSKLKNNQLSIEIPENSNEIQNGTYMLFVVNNSGVPSQGKIVNIN